MSHTLFILWYNDPHRCSYWLLLIVSCKLSEFSKEPQEIVIPQLGLFYLSTSDYMRKMCSPATRVGVATCIYKHNKLNLHQINTGCQCMHAAWLYCTCSYTVTFSVPSIYIVN